MIQSSRETLDYATSPGDAREDIGAPAWRKLAAIALVFCGLAAYLYETYLSATSAKSGHRLPRELLSHLWPLGLVILLGVICLPSEWHVPISRALDRVRHPSATQRRSTTILIWLAASVYLLFTAWRQGRDFGMRTQDEFMYLVQIQILAKGHLFLAAHPMADFFETFYILNKPVYTGMYFPGAGLFFVPAVWLGLPMWAPAVVVTGGVVAMTYRVVTELVDAIAGSLAALLVLSISLIRTLSIAVLSYMPMALLGLGIIWAYLHWRRERKLRWAAAVGVLCGWVAITRPVDAVCFAAPVGLAMVIDLMRGGAKPAFLHSLATLAIVTLVAVPFLGAQLYLDYSVTGSIFKTPVQRYYETYWPGVVMSIPPRILPGEHPLPTPLPQFKHQYEHFLLPGVRRFLKDPHRLARYRSLMQWTLVPPVLPVTMILLPVGLLGLAKARRWVFFATLPIYPTTYLVFPFFISYYAMVLAPITMFTIVLGAHQLSEILPVKRAFLSVWLTASLAALAIASMPELRGKDKPFGSETMQIFNRLSATLRTPAVVFFRSDPDDTIGWKHEQTYNAQTARIDDASIIRAQDLGRRDIELVPYYAEKQPNRMFYLFDQKTHELRQIGVASDLEAHPDILEARMYPSTQPTTNKTVKRISPRRRRL